MRHGTAYGEVTEYQSLNEMGVACNESARRLAMGERKGRAA